MKRTKNQGCGIVVKAQFLELLMISLRSALFCSLLNTLILSVIFYEASDKTLAFQFVQKNQQSQGQRKLRIWDYEFRKKIALRFISVSDLEIFPVPKEM
jgi:hypothetical protein